MLRVFVGAPPDGCTCDHIDRVRDNDQLDNLRWATLSEQNANQVTRVTGLSEEYNHPGDWRTYLPLYQHPSKFLIFLYFHIHLY